MKMLEHYLKTLRRLGYDAETRAQHIRQQMKVNMTHSHTGRGNKAVRRLNEQRRHSIYRPLVRAFNTPGDQFLVRGFRGTRRGIEVI